MTRSVRVANKYHPIFDVPHHERTLHFKDRQPAGFSIAFSRKFMDNDMDDIHQKESVAASASTKEKHLVRNLFFTTIGLILLYLISAPWVTALFWKKHPTNRTEQIVFRLANQLVRPWYHLTAVPVLHDWMISYHSIVNRMSGQRGIIDIDMSNGYLHFHMEPSERIYQYPGPR